MKISKKKEKMEQYLNEEEIFEFSEKYTKQLNVEYIREDLKDILELKDLVDKDYILSVIRFLVKIYYFYIIDMTCFGNIDKINDYEIELVYKLCREEINLKYLISR